MREAPPLEVMLTLRLDRVWTECPWSLVLSCALAAVILLLGAVGPGISRRTSRGALATRHGA